MTRLNLLLLVMLVGSSLYLVQVSHDTRRLVGQLNRAELELRKLETEYGRLEAERQDQATPARVEKTARDRLGMRTATPAIMRVVTVAPSSAPDRAMPPAEAGAPRSVDLTASQGVR